MKDHASIHIGKISGPSGIKGEVKLFHNSGEKERLIGLKELFLQRRAEGFLTPFKVENIRMQGKIPILKLSGVEGRDAAEALTGARVFAQREQLNPPDEDGFYVEDLTGLPVRDEKGHAVGRVAGILSNPAHDLLEIESMAGETFLLPMVDVFILSLDFQSGVVVRIPEGLREGGES